MQTQKKSIFENALFRTRIKSANVKLPEILFGYLLGPLGGLLASGIFGAFLNNYWTEILFKDAMTPEISTFLTLLPLLSAVLIVIGNLVVGQLIERTHTKAGKARPYILLASVLLTAACIIMFLPLPNMGNVTQMVVTAISYNLYYSVAYPLYNTANSTLIPTSTRNSSQRGLLASASNVAGLGVMGAGTMVFPILAGMILKTQIAWFIAFLVIGVITFLATVLQYFFTRERVTEERMDTPAENLERISLGKQLKAVASNKFWWCIIGFYLLFQFAGGIKNLSMVYYCQQVVDNSFWGMGTDGWGTTNTLLSVLGAIPMALAMVLIWPLSEKLTKRWVVFGGMCIAIVGGVLMGISGGNVIMVSVGVALRCLGEAPACYMILAMISDVLDNVEARNGFRADGLTMSIYSSIMVAATPVMTGIFNMITNAGQNTQMVEFSFVWIEVIFYVICAALLIFFFVEKGLQKDRETIKAAQKAAVEAAGGVWEDPEEKLAREEAEAEVRAEEARKTELRALCEKKGLDFEEEETKYQAKISAKKAKK